MTGLIEGTVLIDDGCIFVDTGSSRHVVVWPAGYRYVAAGDRRVIIGAGTEVAQIGQPIILGGGEVHRSDLEVGVLSQLRPPCDAGPFWIATGVAGTG